MMPITRADIQTYLGTHTLAVVATLGTSSQPEAALVEFAATPDLELIFDTLDTTRKCQNLRVNPHIACVIGWESAETLQLEGIADEPSGSELEELLKIYFDACPDGLTRQGWPGLTYFRVRPVWARLSNYNRPRRVEEIKLA